VESAAGLQMRQSRGQPAPAVCGRAAVAAESWIGAMGAR
jgi:hypothetical protein